MMTMTPEELKAHLLAVKEARDKVLAEEQARLEDLRRRQRQQVLYSGLGALAGLAVGYGINRLLNNKQARAKIQESASRLGDHIIDQAEQQFEAVFNPTASQPASFPFFGPQQGDQTIRDADFEVVEDEDG